MTRVNIFEIALIGIPAREHRLLRSVFALSQGRIPSFSLVQPGSEADADIFMVDADDKTAVLEWQRVQRQRGTDPGPTVLLTALQDRTSCRFPVLHRPFVASRLLVMLEKLATDELGFMPPLAIAPEDLSPTTSSTPLPEPTSPEEPDALSALVVDDSLPVRVQMNLALQPLTSSVDFAETGEKALELITSNAYDIVFLDVILPGIDGYEVCRKIKTNDETKHTPVIMLTGNSSPADRIKGKLAGCDTYLIKPVRHAVFQEVIENFLPQLTRDSAPLASAV